MIRGMVETRAAGFWLRALAAALDFGIFALVQASYGALAHLVWSTRVEDAWTLAPMVWTFTFVFAAAYTTVLHALFGQTVGKMLVGARVVVGEDGVPPSFGASLLRYAAYFVSSATLGLGYVMAALRHDKRALHDLIAGTRVERVPRALPGDGPAGPGAAGERSDRHAAAREPEAVTGRGARRRGNAPRRGAPLRGPRAARAVLDASERRGEGDAAGPHPGGRRLCAPGEWEPPRRAGAAGGGEPSAAPEGARARPRALRALGGALARPAHRARGVGP